MSAPEPAPAARPAQPPPDLTADASETPSDLPAGSWFIPATILRPAEQPDEIGRLGKFRVLTLLGHGGMGAVLAAEDAHLRRRVALKVMRPDLMARPEARDRFAREARTAAAVEHDHIVPVYETGEDRGVLYIAMPLLAGESLEDRLRRGGRLPTELTLRVGAEAALGLAAAHAAGLVHRDVKPANLWLEGEPGGAVRRVKILDFGLARVVHDDTHLTTAGGVLGTPAYMSPEQAGGEPVDHRTDLFSLGAVLYRCLTGRLPFPGPSTMAILSALANKTPEPVAALAPDAPPALAALVGRLLAKTPAARPATAAEVAADLARIRAALAEPSRAETVTLAAPLRRPPRRRWAVSLAGLIGLAAAGVGVVVVKVKTPDGKETEVRAPTGSKIDVDAKGNVSVTLPGATAPVAPPPRAVDPPELECVLTAGAGDVNAIVVLPDNDTVVGGYEEGMVRVWSIAGRKVVREWPTAPVKSMALHPDGKTVAVHTKAGELFTRDATTGAELRRYTSWLFGPAVDTFSIDFTPDGGGLVVASDPDRTVSLVDTATGWSRVLRVIPGRPDYLLLRVRPDGAGVAVAAHPLPLRFLDLPAGRVAAEADAPALWTAPVYAPDGGRVYFYPGVGVVEGWEPGRPTAPPRGYVVPAAGNVWGLAVNRAGTLLAGVGGGPDIHLWATAGSPRPARLWTAPARTKLAIRTTFTPDGTRLVTCHDNGTVCVFRVSPDWATPRPAYPPLDPAWLARTRALPADDQVREVSSELARRNPGFDGTLAANQDGGRVVGVELDTNRVEDIAPLRAFQHLRAVTAAGRERPGRLWDLSPLAGMKLSVLIAQRNPIWDLAPLAGMPLEQLLLDSTAVRDLAPLAGNPALANLGLVGTQVRDLTPLAGMRFTRALYLLNTRVTDLAPLRTARLNHLVLPVRFAGDLAVLADTGVETIDFIDAGWRPTADQRRALSANPTLRQIQGKPVAEFWRDLDAAPPAKE